MWNQVKDDETYSIGFHLVMSWTYEYDVLSRVKSRAQNLIAPCCRVRYSRPCINYRPILAVRI